MGFMAKLALLYIILIGLICFLIAKKKKSAAIILICAVGIFTAVLAFLWINFPMLISEVFLYE